MQHIIIWYANQKALFLIIQVGFAQTAALKRFLCNLCLSLLCSGMSSSLRCCAHIGFCSLCLLFFFFFRRFALRGVPQKAPGDVPGQLLVSRFSMMLFVVIFGHIFGHLLAPLASRWPPRALPWRPPGHPLHHFCVHFCSQCSLAVTLAARGAEQEPPGDGNVAKT